MRSLSKVTAEEVVEVLSSDSSVGLSSLNIVSLRREHGSNKLEEEEKVIVEY